MNIRKIIREILNEVYGTDTVKVNFSTDKIMLGHKTVGEFHIFRRRINGDNTKYIGLSKIEIYPKYRNLGYATQAMNQIIKYADKNKLIITLTPDSYKGSNLARLIKFYKSFGFILNKGKDKDFLHMDLMYRIPV